jgi:hypothetical protein
VLARIFLKESDAASRPTRKVRCPWLIIPQPMTAIDKHRDVDCNRHIFRKGQFVERFTDEAAQPKD